MERLARSAAVEERAALSGSGRTGEEEGSTREADDEAVSSADDTNEPEAYHFDPEAEGDEWDEKSNGSYHGHYADDYEYASLDYDTPGLGRYREEDSRPYRPTSPRRFARVSGDAPYVRFASLGDAEPESNEDEARSIDPPSTSDTLAELGADSSPEIINKPSASALGGARKFGSDVFLDDFTESFEDQWGSELDAADEESARREAARKAKKAKAREERVAEEKRAAQRKREAAKKAEMEMEMEIVHLGRSSSKRSKRSKKASRDDDEEEHISSGVKTVNIDDLFEDNANGDEGDGDGANDYGTDYSAPKNVHDYGDYDYLGGDYGDYEAPDPEDESEKSFDSTLGSKGSSSKGHHTSHKSKMSHQHVAKNGASHGGKKSSPTKDTQSDDSSDDSSLFLKAMSRKDLSADASKKAASEIATSLKDKDTKISITSADGKENTFTIGDLGFDDLPGIDDRAVAMYVEGGREYFSELYEKGSEWVNQKYEVTKNTTELWMDEYEESWRSKKRVNVDVFVDAADPYSLELILGPIQNLLKMDLGPLSWTFHARVNVGQNVKRRVNCGGELAGSAARVSCVANAALQCSQKTFQNMTSGLGRFEQRAEEIAQRRAQVSRAKASLGIAADPSTGGFEENFEDEFATLTSDVERELEEPGVPSTPRKLPERLVGRDFRVPKRSAGRGYVTGTKRRSRSILTSDPSEVESIDSSSSLDSSSDYHPTQDTFVDLFTPDDVDSSEYDGEDDFGDDVDEYDLPVPGFMEPNQSESEMAIAKLTDDTHSQLNVFVKCFSTKLLEMESTGAFEIDGGVDSKKEENLLQFSSQCCDLAMASANDLSFEPNSEGSKNSFLMTCQEQAECLASGAGFKGLSKSSDLLDSLTPKHKWLPWVLVEKMPVCTYSCNLQQGIRRAVCNNREGTLPGDCPRFPWGKIWYDEPGISFVGVLGVVLGLALTTGSMVLLAQQAGCCSSRKKEKSENAASDETAPLLNK